MKFKSITNTALAGLMALSLGACSSSSTASSSTAESDDSAASSQTILIATSPDYPPYESLENGEIVGFDYDMCEWLFSWMNENGYNYDHEWKQMSFDTIISAIQTDQVDLGIAGFTYDEDRKVLFSDPYYDSAEVALVAAGSDITSTDDLEGKKIGAQMGTTGEEVANSLTDADNVTAIEDMGVLVETLKAGSVDAVIMDKPVADNYAATGDYVELDGNLLDENNYIIAAEGNDELMDAVNAAIAAFKESDDYDTYVDKWFGATDAE